MDDLTKRLTAAETYVLNSRLRRSTILSAVRTLVTRPLPPKPQRLSEKSQMLIQSNTLMGYIGFMATRWALFYFCDGKNSPLLNSLIQKLKFSWIQIGHKLVVDLGRDTADYNFFKWWNAKIPDTVISDPLNAYSLTPPQLHLKTNWGWWFVDTRSPLDVAYDENGFYTYFNVDTSEDAALEHAVEILNNSADDDQRFSLNRTDTTIKLDGNGWNLYVFVNAKTRPLDEQLQSIGNVIDSNIVTKFSRRDMSVRLYLR